MITLKLPYTTNEQNSQIIKDLRSQYSCVLRTAYNRFHEGLKQKDVREQCRQLNGIERLNSWLLQSAVMDGQALQTRFKNEKVIFGGKKNLRLRTENKISKEEFKEKRLSCVSSQGEALHKGNRMFDFSKLVEGTLIFKVSRKQHIDLQIPKQRKNYQEKLKTIQNLSQTNDLTVTVKLDDKFVYLIYDEPKTLENKLLETRYLGIDLNPNHVGISVMEDVQGTQNVLYVQDFDFSEITEKLMKEKNSSSSERFKYLNNKLNHEVIQVAKQISLIALKFNCKFVFLENLDKNFNTGNTNKGHNFNRLVRNLWKKCNFVETLEKRLQLVGIKSFKVNPAYTSYIGNLRHEYFDSCNAACEIARRGYEVIIKKNRQFYPKDLNIKTSLENQWKKETLEGCKSWKDICLKIKNLKLRYRVLLEETNFKQFKMLSKKSMINIYQFS